MKKTHRIALLSSLVMALLALMTTPSSVNAANGPELERALFTRLLLDDDLNISRLGARSIASMPMGEAKQSLSDLAAEHVMKLVEADPTLTSGNADTIGWHLNVLNTDMARYRDVVSLVRDRITHVKWQARIDLTLQTPDATTPQRYAIRNMDLAAAKADADQTWEAGRQRDHSQFAKIPLGSGLPTVLSTLGTPDAVSPTNVRVAKYGRTQMLTLHYAQVGMVLFKVDPPPARDWKAFEFVDELFDLSAIYVGKHFGTAQAVAGLRGSRFRDYMIYNRAVISNNAEFIPVLEHRLLNTPVAADKFELDALIRCLQIIYRHGSPDAIQSLRRIADAPTERHVKKAAGEYATRLAERPATTPTPEADPESQEASAAEETEDAA